MLVVQDGRGVGALQVPHAQLPGQPLPLLLGRSNVVLSRRLRKLTPARPSIQASLSQRNAGTGMLQTNAARTVRGPLCMIVSNRHLLLQHKQSKLQAKETLCASPSQARAEWLKIPNSF